MFLSSCSLLTRRALAQSRSPNSEAGSSATSQPFDVKAAVDAYLAKVPHEQRARSDAYFEGGYWLLLWDFLSVVLVMWILLRFRWSSRMRDLAERITRFKPLQAALYWLQFICVASVITFPLTVYEGFFREHKYGLSNQTFAAWMRDQAVGLGVSAVLGALLLACCSAWCDGWERTGGCGERLCRSCSMLL